MLRWHLFSGFPLPRSSVHESECPGGACPLVPTGSSSWNAPSWISWVTGACGEYGAWDIFSLNICLVEEVETTLYWMWILKICSFLLFSLALQCLLCYSKTLVVKCFQESLQGRVRSAMIAGALSLCVPLLRVEPGLGQRQTAVAPRRWLAKSTSPLCYV